MRKKKLVHGVGMLGSSPSRVNGKLVKSYSAWSNMLSRCYSNSKNRNNSYKSVGRATVCDSWLTYDTFKEWYDNNYREGFELDKDLLGSELKEYGPTTCVFLPRRLNAAIATPLRETKKCALPPGVFLNNHGSGGHPYYSKVTGVWLGCFATPEEANRAWRVYRHDCLVRLAKHYLQAEEITRTVFDAVLVRAEQFFNP